MNSWCEDYDTRARDVRFDELTMWLDLEDGRTLGIPLVWFPRLLNGTPQQRAQVQIGIGGLHWEELDEDIWIGGLLAGRADRSTLRKREP